LRDPHKQETNCQFKPFKYLKIVYLQIDTNCGNEGAKCLATLLNGIPLVVLILKDNQITDEGMKYLADAITVDVTLEMFEITGFCSVNTLKIL
jgi:hypothetical protein